MSLIPGYLYSIFVSLLWAISSLGMGQFWFNRFKKHVSFTNQTLIESYLVSFLCGCICWIFIGYILFIFHIFNPIVITIILYLAGFISLIFYIKTWLADIRKGFVFDYTVFCLMAALIAQILFCLLPVTAFDATFYHLPLANLMLEKGTLTWTPWIINASLPLNNELMQAIALATGGYVAANLLSWWFGFASVLTLVAIGTRLGNWRIGIWAAVLMSITPLWFWFSTVPYIETSVTFGFCFIALCLISDAPGLLMGLIIGWMCGTKYWGLEVSTIGTLIWLVKSRPGFKEFVKLVYASSAIALFWYVRNTYLFADPFFPFYSQLFSLLGTPRLENALETAYQFPFNHPSPTTVEDWLRLPLRLLFNPSPEYVDDTFKTWGYVGLLSVFWPFALIPALRKQKKEIFPLLIYVSIASFSWIAIHRITDLRYLDAILPIMYILAFVFLFSYLPRIRLHKNSRNILVIIFILFFFWQLFSRTTDRNVTQIPLTANERDIFLDANIDGWFVIDKLNQIDPSPTVYFLYGEGARFYCKFPLLSGWHDPYDFTKFFAHSKSGDELASWLEQAGVDILLIDERRVRQLKGNPEEVLHFLMDNSFTVKYKPILVHYKQTPTSLSEITMFVHQSYLLNENAFQGAVPKESK